jgi:hypothetical protein
VGVHEGIDGGLIRGLARIVGDVEGEKVARIHEEVHVLEVDVVGVDIVGLFPAQGRDRGVGLHPHRVGVGVDDGVFPEGFVPHRNDIHAEFLRIDQRLELGLALMEEAVAGPEGIFFEHFVHGLLLFRFAEKFKGLLQPTPKQVLIHDPSPPGPRPAASPVQGRPGTVTARAP